MSVAAWPGMTTLTFAPSPRSSLSWKRSQIGLASSPTQPSIGDGSDRMNDPVHETVFFFFDRVAPAGVAAPAGTFNARTPVRAIRLRSVRIRFIVAPTSRG
jgi:hypothetical protein